MRTIPLTRGQETIVDDDAPAWIFEVKWHAQCRKEGGFYAARNIRTKDGKRACQWLHAVIANTPPGMQTLHLSGDGLNNCSYNVKPGTTIENMRGAWRPRKNSTSGFRGVSLYRPTGRYVARVGTQAYVGYFATAEEAARARDAKARELGWPEEGMNFPQ